MAAPITNVSSNGNGPMKDAWLYELPVCQVAGYCIPFHALKTTGHLDLPFVLTSGLEYLGPDSQPGCASSNF
jgi:hypothetical protein